MAALLSAEALARFDPASPVLPIEEVDNMPALWDAGEFVASHIDVIGSVTVPPVMARALGGLAHWRDDYRPMGHGPRTAERGARIAGSWAVQDLAAAFGSIVDQDRERSGVRNEAWRPQIWAGNNTDPKGWHFDFVGTNTWIRHTLSSGMPGTRGVRHQFRQADGVDRLACGELDALVEARYSERLVEPGELEVVRFTPYTLHAAHGIQRRSPDHNRLFLVGTT